MITENPLHKKLQETYFQGEYVYNFGGWVPEEAFVSPIPPTPTPTTSPTRTPTNTPTRTSTPTPTPTKTATPTPTPSVQFDYYLAENCCSPFDTQTFKVPQGTIINQDGGFITSVPEAYVVIGNGSAPETKGYAVIVDNVCSLLTCPSPTPTPTRTQTPTPTPTKTTTPTPSSTCPTTTHYLKFGITILNPPQAELSIWLDEAFTIPANSLCNYRVSGEVRSNFGSASFLQQYIFTGNHTLLYNYPAWTLPGETTIAAQIVGTPSTSGCSCPVILFVPGQTTPTPTPTISVSPTQTPSPTPTISVSPTRTPTQTPSGTPTQTPSGTPTQTPTKSLTPTPTITPTISNTPTITPTITLTPSTSPPILQPLSMSITGTGNFSGFTGTWFPSQLINKELYSSMPQTTYGYYKFRTYNAQGLLFYNSGAQQMLRYRTSAWNFNRTFSHYSTFPVETWIGYYKPTIPQYFGAEVNTINGLGWVPQGTYTTGYGNVIVSYNY